jgi:uncharacterized protein YcbX
MSISKVTGLYIYPVKSMKGIAVENAPLTSKGLLYDRHWMVVRESGSFVTQRDIPRMALVNTSLREQGVELNMRGHGSITVPFDLFMGEHIETSVWRVKCQAVDQGEQISNWLTRVLDSNEPLRLVRMDPEFVRPQNKPEIMGKETTTDFADAAPFMVANQASLNELNSVLESNSIQAVPMNRFRPNIVVQGLEPFAEHKLAGLAADNYEFRLRAPCERCIITTMDQETAEKDPHGQPFKTLQTINPIPAKVKAPAFGQYATLTRGETRNIVLGDRIEPIVASPF